MRKTWPIFSRGIGTRHWCIQNLKTKEESWINASLSEALEKKKYALIKKFKRGEFIENEDIKGTIPIFIFGFILHNLMFQEFAEEYFYPFYRTVWGYMLILGKTTLVIGGAVFLSWLCYAIHGSTWGRIKKLEDQREEMQEVLERTRSRLWNTESSLEDAHKRIEILKEHIVLLRVFTGLEEFEQAKKAEGKDQKELLA